MTLHRDRHCAGRHLGGAFVACGGFRRSRPCPQRRACGMAWTAGANSVRQPGLSPGP